jgi:hypothetical protein
VDNVLRKGRAWVPVLKSAVLFILPLPLLLAWVVTLVQGDVGRFTAVSGALAALLGAGVLTWRGLVAQARYYLGERLDPPAVPLKLASAVLTGLGAALAAGAGGHGILSMTVFALLAVAGYFCFYGRDPRRRRIELPVMEGVDRDAVTAQLKQAYGRISCSGWPVSSASANRYSRRSSAILVTHHARAGSSTSTSTAPNA